MLQVNHKKIPSMTQKTVWQINPLYKQTTVNNRAGEWENYAQFRIFLPQENDFNVPARWYI